MAANVSEGSGGVARHIQEISDELAELGADVTHLWRSAAPAVGPTIWRTARFSSEIGRAARAHRPDVLHTHGADGVLANRVAPSRTARVVTSHGDERACWAARMAASAATGDHPPLRSRATVPATALPLFSQAIRSADVVIALHEVEANRFRCERHAPASSVVTIPNGCSPPKQLMNPRVGRIAFLGDWFWRKGADLLPAMFRGVRMVHPSAQLVLIGSDADCLLRFAPEDREAVSATGWIDRDRLWDELAAVDIVVAPSRFEGMSLVLLEALACGIPVVASDIPGNRACAAASLTFVAINEPAAMASAVSAIIGDRPRRERIGRVALAWAQQHSWADAARSTLTAYEAALEARHAVLRNRMYRLAGGSASSRTDTRR